MSNGINPFTGKKITTQSPFGVREGLFVLPGGKGEVKKKKVKPLPQNKLVYKNIWKI